MNIGIKELQQELFMITAKMITELMNYHRKLTNSPKEFWQKDEESIETQVQLNFIENVVLTI